ncbi:DNA polymerase [Mesorhizobium yinganensis]|uniref:DNA polymerase n=1 Tax=Mesorhizobium yinganensis TaxID=3157707 RepID=UPI0032B783F8
MKYATFGMEKAAYKVAILVNDIRRDEIQKAYLTPYGLDPSQVIVIQVHQTPGKKKTPVAEIKDWIDQELVPVLTDLGTEYLIVGDGDYFKVLGKTTKVEKMLGYVIPSDLGPWCSVYVPNYRTIFYDPGKVHEKIALGINALKSWIAGTYVTPGVDIIKFSAYPRTYDEIEAWLERLLEMDVPLTVDIEGFGLKHFNSGIGTITFCWSKHEGIAFPIDYEAVEWTDEDGGKHFGRQIVNKPIRHLLKRFFERCEQKLIYHGIAFDVYVMVYQLFMDHILDNKGLLYGLEVMLRNWECTKLISYLAVNSCSRNKLGLKDQALEFAGDYAQEEIKDITKIPLPELLQYNLVDGLSTWFTAEKNWPKMVADQQQEIYETIFKPATIDIIQMQLTGMPVNMDRVLEVEKVLQAISDTALAAIRANPLLGAYEYKLKEAHVDKRNAELKVKRISINDPECDKIIFKPTSDPQLQGFLFEHLGLPILSRTQAKQPSTDGDTLKALQNHTKDPNILAFLASLIDFNAVGTILNSFIPAMKGAQLGPDGWHYLFGNFNLGGTVSGRLSSSKPNLQNLPANVFMEAKRLTQQLRDSLLAFISKGKLSLGKLIKYCFQAPRGWFFCGIDFASLEDRISALTTKDPNKLKVYTDGYDGHSLRAYAYFGDQMPDIDPNSVASINSIQDKYPPQRQDSKAPTFALTYQGTFKTLMNNCGFTEALAKSIEFSYHELYQVSDAWVADKLNQASKVGYITAAFGLRVRTPMLHQVIRGTSKTPYEAEAEGRTAGNALGQSWCLLNSRAGSEFMGKVRSSDFRHDIKPCAQIHDAQYFLVRDDIDAIRYANDNVVKACEWQDHPDIWHDEVKLGGEFSIFYPDWSKEVGIPNGAEPSEIYAAFEEHVGKLQKAA